jgi:hypothetical protein
VCGFAQTETRSVEVWMYEFEVSAELAGKWVKVIWVESWATTTVAARDKAVQINQV